MALFFFFFNTDLFNWIVGSVYNLLVSLVSTLSIYTLSGLVLLYLYFVSGSEKGVRAMHETKHECTTFLRKLRDLPFPFFGPTSHRLRLPEQPGVYPEQGSASLE